MPDPDEIPSSQGAKMAKDLPLWDYSPHRLNRRRVFRRYVHSRCFMQHPCCPFPARDFRLEDSVDKLREARLYVTSLNRKGSAIARRLAIISFRLNPSMETRIPFFAGDSSYRDRHAAFTEEHTSTGVMHGPPSLLSDTAIASDRSTLVRETIVRRCVRIFERHGIQLEMPPACDIQTEQSADKADDAEKFYPWHSR